jgi:hypothetical protein
MILVLGRLARGAEQSRVIPVTPDGPAAAEGTVDRTGHANRERRAATRTRSVKAEPPRHPPIGVPHPQHAQVTCGAIGV